MRGGNAVNNQQEGTYPDGRLEGGMEEGVIAAACVSFCWLKLHCVDASATPLTS
jgi:hypothetical protein